MFVQDGLDGVFLAFVGPVGVGGEFVLRLGLGDDRGLWGSRLGGGSGGLGGDTGPVLCSLLGGLLTS